VRGGVHLRVAAGERPGFVTFTVSDTGIGIDAQQIGQIFEPFYQVDSTSNRKFGGTGLGLSISRQLAELLGGSVAVSSEPNAGSHFTLSIPANFHAAAPEIENSVPPILADVVFKPTPVDPGQPVTLSFSDDRNTLLPDKKTILIIEDEPTFAGILYDLAREMNYQCLVATYAEEGFELARRYSTHAILLDMKLPDQSGMGLLAQLKDEPSTRHIPVHIISVEDRSEAALQMGAIGYLLKPASREQLRDMLLAIEARTARKMKYVLVAEPVNQAQATAQLIADPDIEVTIANGGEHALALLQTHVFDCLILDIDLPDMSGEEVLQRLSSSELCSFPPVVVHTARALARDEEARLLHLSHSLIIKGARSPERLLDEVTLFLHKVETELSREQRGLMQQARSQEPALQARKILVVDDDVRNIFAVTSALESKGAQVEIGRNGLDALNKLRECDDIDLVLMDIMMPEMDGYEAIREIRQQPQFAKLPIIAVTARATRDDQEKCLRAGANDYIAKPVDMSRLIALIRAWLPAISRT
jgi:CheY-like chemotaxis protein